VHSDEPEARRGSAYDSKLCELLLNDMAARLLGLVVICVMPALFWTWVAQQAAKALGLAFRRGGLINIGMATFAILIVVWALCHSPDGQAVFGGDVTGIQALHGDGALLTGVSSALPAKPDPHSGFLVNIVERLDQALLTHDWNLLELSPRCLRLGPWQRKQDCDASEDISPAS